MKKILISIVISVFNEFKIIKKNIIEITKCIKNHKTLNNADFTKQTLNINFSFFFRFFTIKFPKSI